MIFNHFFFLFLFLPLSFLLPYLVFFDAQAYIGREGREGRGWVGLGSMYVWYEGMGITKGRKGKG